MGNKRTTRKAVPKNKPTRSRSAWLSGWLPSLRRGWRDVVCCAVLLTVSLWFSLPRYRSGLDLFDEGVLACGAVRVLEGQVPHRDFVSIQPPLSFYTAAACFKLFGTSLYALHLFGLWLAVSIVLLVYCLGRPFYGPWVALAAAIPSIFLGVSFIHFVPWPVWQGMAASLTAICLWLRASKSNRPWWAFAAGVFTGAAILLRQDQGLYVVLATVASAGLLRLAGGPGLKRLLTWWAGGMALVDVPLGLYWILKGAGLEMLCQTVLFPVMVYPKTSSSPFPPFKDVFASATNAYIILYYLVPLTVLAVAVWLVRRFIQNGITVAQARLGFLVVLSGLFYCQVLARSDLPHLLVTLPLFFVLAGCCFSALSARATEWAGSRWTSGRRWAQRVAASLALAVVGGFLWVSRPLLVQPLLPASLTLHCPRAGVRVPGADNLDKLVQLLKQLAPPNRSILCLPYQPMFYFLAERRNPTRWNYLWPGDQTPADHLALVQQASNDPPAVVVLYQEDKLQTYAGAIVDYVHRNYQMIVDNEGLMRIYVPR